MLGLCLGDRLQKLLPALEKLGNRLHRETVLPSELLGIGGCTANINGKDVKADPRMMDTQHPLVS